MDITLENCEVYTFDPKDVSVYLEGHKRHIFGEDTYDTYKHVCILIEKNAKAVGNGPFEQDSWQERICRDGGDIVSLDYGETRYWVNWNDDDEYSNSYQKVIEREGDFIIIISKTRHTLEEF